MTRKSENINLSKLECMDTVRDFLKMSLDSSIIEETNSSIKFKKGSFWTLETSPEKASIVSTINFEESNETYVEINLNTFDSILYDIITIPIFTFLIFFMVSFMVYFINSIEYQSYINGESSYDLYLRVSNAYLLIRNIIYFIIPLVFLGAFIWDYSNKRSGLKSLSRRIFSKLRDEERRQAIASDSPIQRVEKVVIKERVKVTYGPPSTCPICHAILNYDNIKLRGVNKAECLYCSSLIDLEEKEI